MSSNTISVSEPVAKSENRISDRTQEKKTSSSATKPPQDQQTLKCPRCNSPNTKFCYYNNYSLSQPRHFCKACRRYWTHGGALRNVPVGGGCRKSKKAVRQSNSSSSSSRLLSVMDDSKFFNGLVSPAMEFQLSGLSLNKLVNPSLSGGSIYTHNNLQLSSSPGDQTTTSNPSCFSNLEGGSGLPLMGFTNYPVTNSGLVSSCGGPVDVNGNLASSIETLSSLNEDLHRKLQQQRMAMLFGHNHDDKTMDYNNTASSTPVEKPKPILFQNLEINNSRKEGSGEAATEWYFGNSTYASASRGNTMNEGSNDWHGVQAWGDLNHYNAFP